MKEDYDWLQNWLKVFQAEKPVWLRQPEVGYFNNNECCCVGRIKLWKDVEVDGGEIDRTQILVSSACHDQNL